MPIAARQAQAQAVVISAGEFRRFCEFFYRRTGISFGDNKRYFVDKRIIDRIQATASGDFESWFERLRRRDAAAEIEQLVNLLTVNETYFYREDHQLDCLAKHILPEIVAGRRGGARVRIWSMPCSTGEEPYSIALYLLENWPAVDNFDIEIMASDIDTDVLRMAERGVFDSRSLHRLPREMVRRYFTPAGTDGHRLIDAVRQAVSFRQVNASDVPTMRSYNQIDVIFCRNMLIYFDDLSRRQVVELFYESLVEGGFICLGHSESMSRISSLFTPRRFPQAIVYQRCARHP